MHVLNILWVVFGIGLMLVLNLKFKINSMVALLVAALSVGMLAGKMCIRDREKLVALIMPLPLRHA